MIRRSDLKTPKERSIFFVCGNEIPCIKLKVEDNSVSSKFGVAWFSYFSFLWIGAIFLCFKKTQLHETNWVIRGSSVWKGVTLSTSNT